jgi:tetratricopeptide (TPR) repeat protein
LQALDMSKLGFMQDLIRGIKKLTKADNSDNVQTTSAPIPSVAPQVSQVDPLLRRAFLSLEDGDFQKADELFEQILNLEPNNARAYVGKLMIERQVSAMGALSQCNVPLDNSVNYRNALRFAEHDYRERLKNYNRETIALANARDRKLKMICITNISLGFLFSATAYGLYSASMIGAIGGGIVGAIIVGAILGYLLYIKP